MRFAILGPLEVCDDDGAVDPGGREHRLVLAALLLHAGDPVPLEHLAGAIRGPEPPAEAREEVLAVVADLNRALAGSASLRRAGSGIRLDVASDDVDRSRFLASAAAALGALERRDWFTVVHEAETGLGLWRGPLLDGLDGVHGVRTEARRLEDRRAELREAQITAMLGLGRLEDAVALAAALRHDDPLRERACWLEMLALHRTGASAAALEVYREHSQMLLEEFGLEPAPEVRDLRIAILRQEPDLLAWPGGAVAQAQPHAEARTPPAPGPATSPAPVPVSAPATALVGRPEEAGLVRRIAAGTDDGLARWLVVTGPAGIGKTRLAEEALAEARDRGFATIRASCPEDDGAPLWWPVRQLVRGLGGDPAVVLTTGRGIDADAARFAVYERLGELVRAAAAHPVLLLVDDVQWMDTASARWFGHLAGSVFSGRLTVILTVRDGEDHPQVVRLLAAVARHPGTTHVELGALTTPEVGELVALVAGEAVSPREAARIEKLTAGNPFFITEFARLPSEQRAAGRVPLAVSAVLRRRLAGVGAPVLEVLQAAAVAGDTMDVDLLAAVLEQDRGAVASLLGEAVDQHLVSRMPGGTFRFAHDLLRREVLTNVSAGQVAVLHARTAAALDARIAGSQDVLARRASHLLAAAPLADPAVVLQACRAAARDADHRWQSEAAADWWQASIEAFDRIPGSRPSDPRRDDLLVNRVASLARAGRRGEVMAVVDAALVEAVRGGRTASVGRLARTLLRTAGAWPWTFGTDPGPLPMRLAAVESLVAHDPAAQARVLAVLAAGRFDEETDGPDRLSARALEMAEALADDEVLADALLGRSLAFAGIASRAEESIRLLERLLRLEHRLHRGDRVLAHILLTMALFTVGDLDGVQEHYRLGVAGSDALRLPISRVQLRWLEATVAVWHGQLDRAERMIGRAFELHRQTELYVPRVHAFAVMALRWEQGRIRDWEPLPDDDQVGSRLAVAAQAMAVGRFDVADRILDAELAHPSPERWTTHAELTLLAHVLADVGDERHARGVLERLLPFSPYIANAGRAGVVGPVALAVARLHVLLGEPEAARGPLAEARRLAERTQGVGSVVRCRLLEAELDDADGAVFQAIVVDAEALGLRQVAARARERALVAVG